MILLQIVYCALAGYLLIAATVTGFVICEIAMLRLRFKYRLWIARRARR